MIFKLKKHYRAIVALMVLTTVDSGFTLQLGGSASWAVFFSKVKFKGCVPSENNKLRNNEGLAAWAQWGENDPYIRGAQRYRKNLSNIAKYKKDAGDDVIALAAMILQEFGRGNGAGAPDVNTTWYIDGPDFAPDTFRDELKGYITADRLLSRVGIDRPDLRGNAFKKANMSRAQKTQWDRFVAQIDTDERVDQINGIINNASDADLKKHLAKKALESAESVGTSAFKLNAAKDGIEYIPPQATLDAAARTEYERKAKIGVSSALVFAEEYKDGYISSRNGKKRDVKIAMQKEYIKTLIPLSDNDGFNEADLLCESLDGEYDVKTNGFFGAMDFAAHLNALYDMNDTVKLGLGISLGYSCRDMSLKNTPVTINEGLFLQMGIVLGFSDWVQLHFGVGGIKRTIGLKKYEGWSDDYDTAKRIVKNPVLRNNLDVNIPNQSLDPDDTLDHIALYGYASVWFLVPIGDGLKFFVNMTLQNDFNKCTGQLGGAGEVEVGGMMYGKIGAGILFEL